MGRWEVLEHIALADCAMDIHGESLPDLFATAALALADLMVDPATLGRDLERTLDLDAARLDLLLYDWLSELIFLKDAEGAVFPWASVEVAEGSPPRLSARLVGGRIEPERTGLRADAKAVTLHQFVLEREGAGWRARVVIDI